MAVSTWELHYKAPRYPADLQFMLGYLEVLKSSYTTLAIDYDQDEDGSIHVMVGDIRTLLDVSIGLRTHGPHKMTVTLQGEADLTEVVGAPGVDLTKSELKMSVTLLETPDGDDETTLSVGT